MSGQEKCPKCGASAWKTIDQRTPVYYYWSCGSSGDSTVHRQSDACEIVGRGQRIATLEDEKAVLERQLAAIASAFTPVRDWYDSDGERTDLAAMLTEAIADLQLDRTEALRVPELERQLAEEMERADGNFEVCERIKSLYSSAATALARISAKLGLPAETGSEAVVTEAEGGDQ